MKFEYVAFWVSYLKLENTICSATAHIGLVAVGFQPSNPFLNISNFEANVLIWIRLRITLV